MNSIQLHNSNQICEDKCLNETYANTTNFCKNILNLIKPRNRSYNETKFKEN